MRTIHNKKTIPINGWRSRTLAQYYFSDYHAEDKFFDDMKFIVPAKIIQLLPDFDGTNQAYANSFKGELLCTIEDMDGDYGFHISLEPIKTVEQMREAYGVWSDCLKTSIERKCVGLYWKDVRPEDLIMLIRLDEIRGARLLINEHDHGYLYDNDLIYTMLQLYGDDIFDKLNKACML